jgi:hypothetical protein
MSEYFVIQSLKCAGRFQEWPADKITVLFDPESTRKIKQDDGTETVEPAGAAITITNMMIAEPQKVVIRFETSHADRPNI